MRILAVAITRMLINVHTYYVKHTRGRVGDGVQATTRAGPTRRGKTRRVRVSGGVQRRAEGAPGVEVCGWQGGTAPCLASR